MGQSPIQMDAAVGGWESHPLSLGYFFVEPIIVLVRKETCVSCGPFKAGNCTISYLHLT